MNDPRPKPKTIPPSEPTTEADKRTARSETAIRETTKANEELQKRGLKLL